MAKDEIKQTAVRQVLADVRSDKIAIPELQRPFVWKTPQVRVRRGIGWRSMVRFEGWAYDGLYLGVTDASFAYDISKRNRRPWRNA